MNFEAQSENEPLTPEQEAQLRDLAIERAPAALAQVDAAETDADRFCALPDAALAAIHLERYELAADLATRTLEMAPNFERNWNYGNAIHAAHTVRGLLALRAGDTKLAIQELINSGKTKGSPQLGSFGPTMELAKALLRKGESASVLEYLQQCRGFWKMGNAWLDIWEQKIRAGDIPNAFMHSYK